mmetsp:Transcript_459/g.1590  ORF Transcript_459/g.1590 Transcript_459/m.1590 type:complete len:432 (+) Transcript_459:128-1423(+)
MEYLHPPPSARSGTVAKRGFLSGRKNVLNLTLENQVLTCTKPVTNEVKWCVDLKECSIHRGDRKDEIAILQGKWKYKFVVENGLEYKSWYSDILYASQWKFDSYYRLEKEIGEGGFGKVFKCRNLRSSKMYACKVIQWHGISESEKARVKSEIHMLTHLRGERFVRLYDVFEDAQNKYLVMELIKGHDLFTMLEQEKRLDEKVARRIMHQIFQALVYMHRQGYMHRDLKPENIMVGKTGNDYNVKIIDFGLADKIENGNNKKVLFKGTGTTGYMAPETIIGENHNEAVDIWGCGCILFMLLSGSMPFTRKGRNMSSISLRSVSAQYTFSEVDWQGVSKEAKSLVRMMLQVQPIKRPDARVILEHKWFKKSPYSARQQPPARLRLRGLVHAVLFLLSWKVERTRKRQSIASLRGYVSTSVTDIFARNSSNAE